MKISDITYTTVHKENFILRFLFYVLLTSYSVTGFNAFGQDLCVVFPIVILN